MLPNKTCRDSVSDLCLKFGLSETIERIYDLIDIQGTDNDQLLCKLEKTLEDSIAVALELEAQYDLTPGAAFEAIRKAKFATA